MFLLKLHRLYLCKVSVIDRLRIFEKNSSISTCRHFRYKNLSSEDFSSRYEMVKFTSDHTICLRARRIIISKKNLPLYPIIFFFLRDCLTQERLLPFNYRAWVRHRLWKSRSTAHHQHRSIA